MAVAYDIPLHDIKPLMEVPDSSFTILMIVVVILTAVFTGASYLFYRYMESKKRVDHRKIHYKALQKVDFRDAKRAAYAITEHGRIFAEDSERLNESYLNLVSRLEAYKYKKVVSTIDDESRSYYKIYLEMIDV